MISSAYKQNLVKMVLTPEPTDPHFYAKYFHKREKLSSVKVGREGSLGDEPEPTATFPKPAASVRLRAGTTGQKPGG